MTRPRPADRSPQQSVHELWAILAVLAMGTAALAAIPAVREAAENACGLFILVSMVFWPMCWPLVAGGFGLMAAVVAVVVATRTCRRTS